MSHNQKLTPLLKGRTITGTQNQDNKLLITFHDGSLLTVKTKGNANVAATGGTVQSVQQNATTLTLDFADGSHLAIPTEEAASSVLLRDKNHVLEYAD